MGYVLSSFSRLRACWEPSEREEKSGGVVGSGSDARVRGSSGERRRMCWCRSAAAASRMTARERRMVCWGFHGAWVRAAISQMICWMARTRQAMAAVMHHPRMRTIERRMRTICWM